MARKPNLRDAKRAAKAEDDSQDDDSSDETVLVGGPGQDDTTGGDSVELLDYTIGGKKHKLPKDVVEALQEQNRPVTPERIAELEDQIARLRRGDTAPAARTQAEQVDDYDKIMKEAAEIVFTDPEKAFKMIGDASEARATKKLTGAYENDQNQKLFWEAFDSKYPELKDVRWIVKQVAAERMDDLEGLSVKEGHPKLAKWANERLATLVKKVDPGSGEKPKTRTMVEGGDADDSSTRRPQGTATTRPAAPANRAPSLTELLKERRNAKRAARVGRS